MIPIKEGNKRVSLTLEPELYELLVQDSCLNGVKPATRLKQLFVQYLNNVTPPLSQTSKMVENEPIETIPERREVVKETKNEVEELMNVDIEDF